MSSLIPSDPAEVEAQLWADFSGDVAYDVGANYGQSLHHLVTRFEKIYAFEPAPETFKALKWRWARNPKVTLRQEAITDHDGMLVASVREGQPDQLAALGMPYDGFIPGKTSTAESLPWGREISTQQVQALMLDTLLDQIEFPDFVKVDTEGHEAQVVRGASKILQKGTTSWLIEFHLKDWYDVCISLLEEAGYQPETVRHPHYQPESELWHAHGWIRAAAPR